MDTVPPTQIFGVYQETGKLADAKEYAHKTLQKRVSECMKLGQNVILMGDFNAPINETARPFNVASKKILEWEESGEIRILNNKQIPTRVQRKGDNANCLDLMMITAGLEKRTYNYELDVNQEWSPATAEQKGGGKSDKIVYLRGKPTDHKAQKVTVMLDLVKRGQAGNRAIINYNNRDGWKLYYKVTNEFAPEIMKTVRTYADKNEIQKEFKNKMQKIYIKCFGIKYKKVKDRPEKWASINTKM